MSNNPKCPYCGNEMLLHEVFGDYFYMCAREGCKSMAPMHSSKEEAYAAAMKRDRAKGSMSLYIYKKLGEWLGAPCNLSFGELCVGEFLSRYCEGFCDYCNSEYEKCWKKFFETLEETEANNER